MLTVNGAIYKDVNQQDFNHYFAATVMAWKLSPTKRRVFIVGNCNDGNIKGTYLTREREFKDRNIAFKGWWDSLDAITLQPLMFNLPQGAGIWKHSLNKNQRKSFPWMTNAVKFYGAPVAANKTSQIITYTAFAELYGMDIKKPHLVDALKTNEPAVVTKEGFLVDRQECALMYRAQLIAGLVEGRIKLRADKQHLMRLLLWAGVDRALVDIVDTPLPIFEVVVPMKYNKDFIMGYDQTAFPECGYSVVRWMKPGNPGEIRTYKGKFPGKEHLLAGWTVHNYWGQ